VFDLKPEAWMLGAVLALLTGCVSMPERRPVPLTGDPVIDGRLAIERGPARDKVLWQYRMAAALMRRGEYAQAKQALDEALMSLGGIQNPDPNAKKARSLFHGEARKTFYGEPYERIMAYYYRGILYWMDGEPDNARACFRSAQLQDADSENKTYASDYVLLDYLDGLASVKLAGDGADQLKRAQASSKWGALPAYDQAANVLFFLEFGQGPSKYATGAYNEQLRFMAGKSLARSVRIRVNQSAREVRPFDDLTYQATTRGGRVMDHILANKAVFKSASDTVGNVSLVSGLVLASNRKTQEAGLGLAAFGLVSKLVSSATTPAADTRCWDNLPQYLSFVALRLPPGQHQTVVEFLAEDHSPITSLTKNINVNVAETSRDTVVFVSDKK
jgi:tetratricopeptide (TPR) repeat protein